MGVNEPWWSVRAHQHRTMRAKGERGKENGVMGKGLLASNLQGLASNTIWMETIQCAGIREGREGQVNKQKRSTGQKAKTRLRSVSSVEKQKAGSIPERH